MNKQIRKQAKANKTLRNENANKYLFFAFCPCFCADVDLERRVWCDIRLKYAKRFTQQLDLCTCCNSQSLCLCCVCIVIVVFVLVFVSNEKAVSPIREHQKPGGSHATRMLSSDIMGKTCVRQRNEKTRTQSHTQQSRSEFWK